MGGGGVRAEAGPWGESWDMDEVEGVGVLRCECGYVACDSVTVWVHMPCLCPDSPRAAA